MDVRLAPNLNIGDVMGTGDEVPLALRGLGASVQLLGSDELAWADLGRYDAIFIGVRAYDSRQDLRANNAHVPDYASAGGTVVVQYNRGNGWTQYAPFPVRFSNTRVTDENGPVQTLSSDDRVLRYPNEIGDATWRNWIQERGTYFIVPDDQRYTDLVQIHEPFEHDAGWKRGRSSPPTSEGGGGSSRGSACGVRWLPVLTARSSCSPTSRAAASSLDNSGGRSQIRNRAILQGCLVTL